MKLMSPIEANRLFAKTLFSAACSRLGRSRIWLMFAASIVLLAGCASVGTTVDNVWRDSSRADGSLGKTLVVALVPEADLVTSLENEWVRQLRELKIDAHASNVLLPGELPPNHERLVELVKSSGFNTLLVTRLVNVKRVEREVSTYQVAAVETVLYDSATEKRFWSARTDTFMADPASKRDTRQRDEVVREFVATLTREMSKSKVL